MKRRDCATRHQDNWPTRVLHHYVIQKRPRLKLRGKGELKCMPAVTFPGSKTNIYCYDIPAQMVMRILNFVKKDNKNAP